VPLRAKRAPGAIVVTALRAAPPPSQVPGRAGATPAVDAPTLRSRDFPIAPAPRAPPAAQSNPRFAGSEPRHRSGSLLPLSYGSPPANVQPYPKSPSGFLAFGRPRWLVSRLRRTHRTCSRAVKCSAAAAEKSRRSCRPRRRAKPGRPTATAPAGWTPRPAGTGRWPPGRDERPWVIGDVARAVVERRRVVVES
jgi:hypothetical protein